MQRVAIIGYGFMGKMHLEAYRPVKRAEVVAVVTSSGPKPGLTLPTYPTLDALLKERAIDAVNICLPTEFHRPVVEAAAAAGKHVFCEKPMALTVSDAQAMIDVTERAGVFLQLGHCLRFWPEYAAFAELFRGGSLGKLLSWSLQRRAAPPGWSKNNWLSDNRRTGGAALDLHVHDTDFVLSLLGIPSAVTSTGSLDHIFTQYHFDDGVAVNAEGGWDYPAQWGFQMAFQAVFERGAVEYDSRAKPTMVITQDNEATQPMAFTEPQLGRAESGGNIAALGGFFNQLNYFIDCLESKRAPTIATGQHGMEAVRVTLAEIESMEKRTTVSV